MYVFREYGSRSTVPFERESIFKYEEMRKLVELTEDDRRNILLKIKKEKRKLNVSSYSSLKLLQNQKIINR